MILREIILRTAILAIGVLATPAFLQAKPKNILLLIADDLGNELGCYGDPVAHTPNLDALAKSGTRFTHAFASVTSCSPSRATILSGQPTHQCGQYGLAHATHNSHSFRTVKSAPALLQSAGYVTGVVGKYHVQPKEIYPMTAEIADPGRNPVTMAAKAKQFMQQAGDKPFFLLVGFTDPHRAARGFANDGKYPPEVPRKVFDPAKLPLPYFVPDQPEARADLADYYQSVARLDDGVGRVLKTLDELQLADSTLVIFISDNGIPFPGAKTTLYDAGIRLPCIVRKPGQQPGIIHEAMVSFTDLAPTMLEWAGLSKPDAMPGRSFLTIIDQPTVTGWDTVYASHQYHEITMYYPMRMIRTRNHKLIYNIAHPLEYPSAADIYNSPTWQGILKRNDPMLGQRPLKDYQHRAKWELYDLQSDPNELKNRADDATFAPILAQLQKQLRSWQVLTKDPWLVKERYE